MCQESKLRSSGRRQRLLIYQKNLCLSYTQGSYKMLCLRGGLASILGEFTADSWWSKWNNGANVF
jgi:hypothetical protein